ncbi:UdgX family uracil-DNA binding protein [Salipiger profundus]|jgi:probable DNA metabolism protein|uniref:Type-4 uracil-DNA glycosylase n=3 Tax=Salipiger TaxID=263377 RepID=A0A1U7CZP4_9RHOB|nr:UdgX family uracil-DNA binding protein [Salipiger profundus]APX21379.1 DNA polymerase [Salipiger profundus]GGA02789.1 uracil-DNA glycosylase [Salipiger profundus]SFC23350.1 DNA polymerase [Salipiger profundus]
MRVVVLPEIGTWEGWRDEARALLGAGVPPEEVLWQRGGTGAGDLFAEALPPVSGGAATVPRRFVDLARLAVCHSDPERFARLYALLWALRDDRRLLEDRGDARVDRLTRMAKEVSRDRHKMTAFVRFREIGAPGAERRAFAAWFEPSHHIVELTAPFFVKRFGDMDWAIFTPDLSAHFEAGRLRIRAGAARPELPADAAEDLWRTYFRNIFNPARLKTSAMQSEMPKKYWKNMPEASLIPELIAGAQARAREMAEAAPTLPPPRAARIADRRAEADATAVTEGGPEALAAALSGCRRCPLWADATQAVPGEGPPDAALMIVGEQPGDREDLAGRPFVGPAGQLFDAVAGRVGLARERAYVTNAVKHFKFTPRGKRRIHQRPNAGEVAHCRWWLDLERERVQPKLILALGATAAESLTGDGRRLGARRGGVETTPDGTPVLITYHPSYLLRLPEAERFAAMAAFEADLGRAVEMVGA